MNTAAPLVKVNSCVICKRKLIIGEFLLCMLCMSKTTISARMKILKSYLNIL